MTRRGLTAGARRIITLAAVVGAGVGLLLLGTDRTSQSDRVVVTSRIASSAADAEERASGTMRLASDDLELTVDDSVQTVGLRFDDLLIPPGARIVEAHLEFVVERSSVGASSLEIAAEASDRPPDFTTRMGDLSTRPLTDVRVKWAPGPWLPKETDLAKRSPDLNALLQAVVDRPGWSQDDPLVLLISGIGTRIATSFDGDPAAAPLLTVSYEPPDNEPPHVAITTPSEGEVELADGAVELVADATDPEDGDISNRVLWSSDLDGQLGSGETLQAELSAGPHRLTAVVYDLSGRGTAASIDIVVKPPDPVILAAGEVESCLGDGDTLTASIIEKMPWATVLALGDQAHPDGTATQYQDCFDETWGRFRSQIRAVPGNRDYHTDQAGGFYTYFGEQSGERGTGWYAFDLGSWRVIGLNTNCEQIGGCDRASPQLLWLADDLATNQRACTLVFGHQARFGSDLRGGDDDLADIWSLLEDHNVDIVLAGHDRSYERFAPQRANATADPAGVRQFVVGTGGADPTKADVDLDRSGAFTDVGNIGRTEAPPVSPRDRAANSEIFDTTSRGLLQLVLGDDSYTWTFLPADRALLRDRGRQSCTTDPADRPPPVDVVVDPIDGPVTSGSSRSLTATALAGDGSDVSDRIRWRSNRDGELGVGAQVELGGLTPGRHLVVAEMPEATGLLGASTTVIEVLSANGATVETATAFPARSADDAEEAVDTGVVSLESSDLELSDERRPQLIGIRFPDLDVPAGATVVRADIQFTAASVEVFTETADLRIHGDATGRGQRFNESLRNLSRRGFTDASVSWSPPWWDDPGDATADQRTPDLAPIIQELIDQRSWRAGDAVVLLFTGRGSRTAASFDSGLSVRPVLEVEFVR